MDTSSRTIGSRSPHFHTFSASIAASTGPATTRSMETGRAQTPPGCVGNTRTAQMSRTSPFHRTTGQAQQMPRWCGWFIE